MDRDPLSDVRRALAARDRAKGRHDQSIRALHAAILAALDSGIRQADIVRATGYTRERIRQLDNARKSRS